MEPDDGLAQPPTDEEMQAVGKLALLAGALLFATCAVMGWVVKRVLSGNFDRAWDRDYWEVPD